MTDRIHLIEYQYSDSPEGPWRDGEARKTDGPARDWTKAQTVGDFASGGYMRSRVRVFVPAQALRDAINIDRTGLAATLNHVRAIVSGYRWIPDGEWACYDHTQRTVETLRREVGWLIEGAVGAIARGLAASGKRADEAVRTAAEESRG